MCTSEMAPRSFARATTSWSSFARASFVSTALLNSKRPVVVTVITAGFLGGSGFATGLGSGAGGGGAGFAATGGGGGAGLATGSGAGAGFSGSLAQLATRTASAARKRVADFTWSLLRFLVCHVAPNLITTDAADTSVFREKTDACVIKFRPQADGKFRQGNAADLARRGDAALVSRLRHERDRRARPARRARRPEAGPSPRALRHARGQQRLEPALCEVRADRGRRAGQVPPAR